MLRLKLSIFFFLCVNYSSAQDATSSSGSNASGTGGTVSYTVGQVVYTTHIGTNGSVAQGVQQPYEISVVNGIEEANDINLILDTYPNPATDFVKLKIENYKSENLGYQLYDIQGKIYLKNKIESNETNIAIGDFAVGIYFLRVTDTDKYIKTFKIIKN